jgi:hypothetical protein
VKALQLCTFSFGFELFCNLRKSDLCQCDNSVNANIWSSIYDTRLMFHNSSMALAYRTFAPKRFRNATSLDRRLTQYMRQRQCNSNSSQHIHTIYLLPSTKMQNYLFVRLESQTTILPVHSQVPLIIDHRHPLLLLCPAN